MIINKRDVLLTVFLLIAAAICFFAFNYGRQCGKTVTVYIDNVEYARLPLEKDRELEVHTDGGGINVLEVKNGKAYVKSASCPDKICVNTGAISKEGSVIACVPNRVVVVIE